MKLKIRRGNNDDLDGVFNLHNKCFELNDRWYKSIIAQSLKDSIIIQVLDMENDNYDDINKGDIIGVLLQGDIVACGKDEKFEPINAFGLEFSNNNNHIQPTSGITMICVHPSVRGKGFGKKLIEKHFIDNKNKLLCLNTRKSNKTAQILYEKMGYIHIGDIINKYFLPDENSHFMVYYNNFS